MTPPALEHVIAKCLGRERDERWESAADVASQLEWIAGSGSGESAAVRVETRPRHATLLAVSAIAAVVIIAAIVGGFYVMRRLRLAEQPVISELLTDEPLTPALFGAVALSPDGTQLLMLVGTSGKPSIAVRNLATGETKKLAGTEGASFPFWAPDSRRIAFFAGRKLKTVALSGGSIQVVCDAKAGRGGSWSGGGIIVFAPDIGSPICKVSESGGSPVPVTHLAPKEAHRQPVFLPDGKRFLYSVRVDEGNMLYAGSIDGSLQKRVVENASNAAFAGGRLFFVRDGNLVSQPFDPGKLELSGTLTPVADHVEYFRVRAIGNFSVTESKMVYVGEASGSSEIVAHDRNGRVSEIRAGAADYRILDLSPDDRTLAVAVDEHVEQGDVWLVQLEGGAKSRFSFTDGGALSGAFSPDGTRFAMTSGFFGQAIALNIRSVVSNETQKLLDTRGACIVTGWSRDGKYLVVDTQDPKSGFDVQTVDIATKTMTPVVAGPADELAPALSPDGKWLAYVSTESGRPEVYLTAFPSGAGKWQPAQEGGNAPHWSRDGKQLFYAKDDRLMAVDFHDGAVPQFGPPVALPVIIVSDRIFVNSYSAYAVASDGRFFTTQPVGHTQPAIHLVTNWAEASGH
jgi:Tol biopolymer transport system component